MRKRLLAWLFATSQRFYTRHFKKKKEAWNLSKKELLLLPKDTLGYHLGAFLDENKFELLPKVERHDAYHVVTGYGTKVEDEIALQYLCFGNGKRSKYLFGVLLLGTILLPEYVPYYFKSFQLGKNCHAFHHYDYLKLLEVPLVDFRSMIFSAAQIRKT